MLTPTVTVAPPASASGEASVEGAISRQRGAEPTADATIAVSQSAGLTLQATPDTKPYPSGQTSLRLVVENPGELPRANPVVELDLPAGWQVVGAGTGPGTLRTRSGEWLVPALDPGGTAQRSVTISVPQDASLGAHEVGIQVRNADDVHLTEQATVTVEFRRGFFSNNAESPVDLLTNVGNLTVIGFLLSIAGILLELRRGI